MEPEALATEQIVLERKHGGRGTGRNADLGVHVLHVVVGRLRCDHESLGNRARVE